MTIAAFPLSTKTAHSLARRLRTKGFWTLPISVWNGAADLVEVFAEYPPTPSQVAWLAAHRQFLIEATQ